MRSRLRVLGHPVHPMLVDFPVAIFPLLVGLDILRALTKSDALWPAGFWLVCVALVFGVAAIVTGLFDYVAIPRGVRAKTIANWHVAVALLLAALYLVDLAVRWPVGSVGSTGLAATIDVAGLVLVAVQGWLGGELMAKHQVGILSRAEGADPPPVPSTEPASGTGGLPRVP